MSFVQSVPCQERNKTQTQTIVFRKHRGILNRRDSTAAESYAPSQQKTTQTCCLLTPYLATEDCSGRFIVSLDGIAIAHQPDTNGKRDRSGALPEICSQGKRLTWGKRLPSQ